MTDFQKLKPTKLNITDFLCKLKDIFPKNSRKTSCLHCNYDVIRPNFHQKLKDFRLNSNFGQIEEKSVPHKRPKENLIYESKWCQKMK